MLQEEIMDTAISPTFVSRTVNTIKHRAGDGVDYIRVDPRAVTELGGRLGYYTPKLRRSLPGERWGDDPTKHYQQIKDGTGFMTYAGLFLARMSVDHASAYLQATSQEELEALPKDFDYLRISGGETILIASLVREARSDSRLSRLIEANHLPYVWLEDDGSLPTLAERRWVRVLNTASVIVRST